MGIKSTVAGVGFSIFLVLPLLLFQNCGPLPLGEGDNPRGIVGQNSSETSSVRYQPSGQYSIAPAAPAEDTKVAVGVIRWDFWFKDNPTGPSLKGEWYDRVPFFVWFKNNFTERVWEGDSMPTMDQEIGYARNAGIDYFNFFYYGDYNLDGSANADRVGRKSLDNYLASRRQNEINFALTLSAGAVGPASNWEKAKSTWTDLIAEPGYQRVLGGRPIVYFAFMDWWEHLFAAHPGGGRGALDELRSEIRLRTGHEPYFVLMHFYVESTGSGPSRVKGLTELVPQLGMDAASAYSNPLGEQGQALPYETCAAINEYFRNDAKAHGLKVVPIVNTGWDPRPVAGKDPYVHRSSTPDYCIKPTPQQIAANVSSALSWSEENPSVVNANTIMVYAWNELAEGGWLVPTKKEGTDRLLALRQLLRGSYRPLSSSTQYKGYVDSVTLKNGLLKIHGWACGAGSEESVSLHVYAGGEYGQGGVLIADHAANHISEAAVQAACSSQGDAHRYFIELPEERYLAHRGKSLFFYAVSKYGSGLIDAGRLQIP